MTLSLGVLAVWFLLSPLAAVLVGAAIARADVLAQRREALLRQPRPAAPWVEPAPSAPTEVVHLRLVQRV